MRDVNAVLSGCLSLAPERLTVQKASGTRRAPSTYWKTLAAPQFRGKPLRRRTLQLSNSQAENPTLRRAAKVLPPPWPECWGQNAGPSSERLEISCSHPSAAPIWSNRRNRGMAEAPTIRKDVNSYIWHHEEAVAWLFVVNDQCFGAWREWRKSRLLPQPNLYTNAQF